MLACVCQPATVPAVGAPPLKLGTKQTKGAGMGGQHQQHYQQARIYRIPVVITSEPKNSTHLKRRASRSSAANANGGGTCVDVGVAGKTVSVSVVPCHDSMRIVAEDDRSMCVDPRAANGDSASSSSAASSSVLDSGTGKPTNEDSSSDSRFEKLPEGVQLTLSELREMACRQQSQIETQHQLLAAKEQRLRYLKEQEARQQRVQAESERLRRLRDRVDAQELKLRKLRAIRGQVDHQKQNNISLTSDLDSIRALFNEKEKELSLAVAKVDELTKQLEELRRGRTTATASNREPPPASALELDKLRRELMYRNKLNEQQNHRLNQQREALTARQEEMSAIDKRISELQERLHRKRMLNQQLANQISAASHKAAYHQFVRLTGSTDQNSQGYPRKPPQNSNHPSNGLSRSIIAAVEPYNHVPPSGGQPVRPLQETTTYHPVYQQNHHIKSDSEPKPDVQDINKLSTIYANRPEETDLLKDFSVSKSDPKYQTLPYNTKFTVNLLPGTGKGRLENQENLPDGKDLDQQQQQHLLLQPSMQSQMVHSAPLNVLNKNIATPLNQNDVFKRTDKDEIRAFAGGLKENSHLGISNNINSYQKPISSVAPTTVHHTGKLSNIYQTSSIKVQPVEPQTIHSKLSSPLSPPQSTSTPLGGTPEVSSDKVPKPALPPKPLVKTPPRQTQSQTPSGDDMPPPPPLPLTEPPTEEKPAAKKPDILNPLSIALTKIQGNHLGQMSINTVQKGLNSPLTHSPLSQNSPTSTNSPMQHSPVTNSPVLQHSPQLSTITTTNSPIDNMPIIKAKPLTIKKQMLSEQPKLRTMSSYSRFNRRIEMPPAFNFPETETVELNGNDAKETTKTLPDETDKSSDSSDVRDVVRRCKKGNLKQTGKANLSRRVSFDPLALLLDASLEGELELVKKTATQVGNPSAANDEGITALHNAICAGHLEIVKFLVEFGCDVNAQDSDGWTPLHCAASCNNVAMVRFLVEHGACIFATTLSDHETAAEKCEEDEEGFDGCSEYLYSVQEKLGILSGGAVFAVFDYTAHQPDELSFQAGQQLTILRKGDESEREWWWSRLDDKEGYVPRNLLGLYPRVTKSEE